MPDVLVAGHLCIDIIAAMGAQGAGRDDLLAAGSLTMLEHGAITTGGVVANTGLALHRLGMDVALSARLGDDAIGLMTRQLVARHREGLADGLRVVPGETSGYTIVVNAPGRERSFLVFGGANDRFGPDDVDADLLASSRIVHVGYPPLLRRMFQPGDDCLVDLLKLAHAAGATTSLDLSMPDPSSGSGQADWPSILARALPHVDLFVPSVEELLFMLQRDRYDALMREAGPARLLDAITWQEVCALGEQSLDLGARVVMIKLGPRGAYLVASPTADIRGRGAPADPAAWRGVQLWAPCYQVEVANAVGAGDAAVAGLLTGLLGAMSSQEALLTAMAVGACNVEEAGGANGVVAWQETMDRMRAGWPQREGIEPSGADWIGEEQIGGARVWVRRS